MSGINKDGICPSEAFAVTAQRHYDLFLHAAELNGIIQPSPASADPHQVVNIELTGLPGNVLDSICPAEVQSDPTHFDGVSNFQNDSLLLSETLHTTRETTLILSGNVIDSICPAEAHAGHAHLDSSLSFHTAHATHTNLSSSLDNSGFTSEVINENSISVYYQNVRGLRTKVDEFFLAATESNYDVIIITETWLNDQFYSQQLFGDRYTVYRKDRNSDTSTKKRGGGVLIAVTNRLSSALPAILIDQSVEHLWVNIFVNSCVVAIGAIYLPPEFSNDVSIMEKHLRSAQDINNSLHPGDCHLLMGDYNQTNLVWSNASSGHMYADASWSNFSQASCCLLDGCALLDMKQINYLKNHRDRTLDLIFVNTDAVSKCVVQAADDPLVDLDPYHPTLFLSLTCNRRYEEADIINEFDFKRSNFEALNYALSNIDWTPLVNASNVDNAVQFFSDTLIQLFHRHVPAPLPRRKPPWSNSYLRSLKRRRSNALRKYANSRTPDLKRIFNVASRRYRSYNKLMYVRYTKRMESSLKKNPKRFWSFMNEKWKESGLPTTVFLNDKDADTHEGICNLFAEHFSGIFRQDLVPTHLVDNAMTDVPMDVLDIGNFSFSENDVFMAIKKLKYSSAAGPDGIPSIILIKCR